MWLGRVTTAILRVSSEQMATTWLGGALGLRRAPSLVAQGDAMLGPGPHAQAVRARPSASASYAKRLRHRTRPRDPKVVAGLASCLRAGPQGIIAFVRTSITPVRHYGNATDTSRRWG